MENTRPIVLFDFDGVIADTFAIAHEVARKACVYVTEREYRKQFEGSVSDIVAARLSTDHGDPCDHALDWLAHFGPRFYTRAKPFAEMPNILKDLCVRYRIIIVSSTHGSLIEHFLDKFALRGCIEAVMGLEVHTSKYEKFNMIFAEHPEARGHCALITDTLGDINEAAQAEVASIGVLWGFQDRETLQRGEPFRIVEKPSELPDAIDDFFARA